MIKCIGPRKMDPSKRWRKTLVFCSRVPLLRDSNDNDSAVEKFVVLAVLNTRMARGYQRIWCTNGVRKAGRSVRVTAAHEQQKRVTKDTSWKPDVHVENVLRG